MTKKDVQLGEPESETVVSVNQRHLHLIGQPLRKQGAQFQPTKARRPETTAGLAEVVMGCNR